MNRRRCRVLYTQTTKGGGSELSLYELVRGLDTDKYEPIILFYWRSPYQDLYEAAGAKIITLSEIISPKLLPPEMPPDQRPADKNAFIAVRLAVGAYRFLRKEPRLAMQVARIMKNESVDIVHHNCSPNMDRTMVLAAAFTGLPQISHCRQFSNLTFIARRLIRFVDAFVYITQAISECYTGNGITVDKGHVIYDPINGEAFSEVVDPSRLRSELGITAEDRVISNVGRIVPWKGQEEFLRAAAEVVKAFPSCKFLIVGEPGPALRHKRYDDKLRRMTRELGLDRHVIFTGLRSDIPQIMALSDVVVHSATKPEPFGRVIAEAMMAGRPVVATAGGGVPEIIEDGVTGLLVPPGDVGAMAEAIKRILSDPEQGTLMGDRAQQDTVSRFSVERHVKAIDTIYSGVMARSSTGC